MKFRKKPVLIEAFQYDGDLKDSDGLYYVPQWAADAFESGVMYYGSIEAEPSELFIKTLEGDHHVSLGDYVIQGVKGELYPCKPDIFKMTYDYQNQQCKLCNGEKFEFYEDTMGLDKNRLFMTTEGDFGEMCVVSFKVKYCPNCGKEIKNEASENRNK